jgi:hypothetical protein
MSVNSNLRKSLAVSMPSIVRLPARLLPAIIVISLVAYLGAKIYGVINGLPTPYLELLLLPAGACALALVLRLDGRADAVSLDVSDEAESSAEQARVQILAICGGALLLLLTMTLVVANTVPLITSEDESAIINGGYQVAHEGSLRIDNSLNDTYGTNIIGGLRAVNKTATDRYYGAFPGSALLYAPFSYLPSDTAYRLYTALFAGIVPIALYVLARTLLRSWLAAFIATLIFVASPAFAHWSVTVFNNVPVLAMELSALAFVIVPERLDRRHVGFAGALMGLALFVRVTELMFVLPMLALVLWRTRAWKDCLPLLGGVVAGGLLVLMTNWLFFGDPFFFPHVGTPYISLHTAPAEQHSSQSLLERYFLFAIGTSGSASNFSASAKISNVWFHIRYLGSSTFAFPFLPVAFAGLALLVAAGRRNGRLLLIGIVFIATPVIAIYGQQHNNYFGFGLPITRSSFVRYSLPIYALLAIAAGGFFLELGRLLRMRDITAAFLFVGLVLVLGCVSIGQSYDREVYGFNRLNAARDRDRSAWRDIDEVIQKQQGPALLIVDRNSMKMVPNNKFPDTINYSQIPSTSWQTDLYPVISAALDDRKVYLLISEIQTDSQHARDLLSDQFYLETDLRVSPWGLYQVEPPIHEGR